MQHEYLKKRKVLSIVIALNILVALINLVSGLANNPGQIFSFANGFNSIPIISLAILIASDNSTKNAQKIEAMASIFIGFILLILGYQIFMSSAHGLKAPHAPRDLNIIMIIITTMINIFITKYEMKKGKETASALLISDAYHTLAHVKISLAIIIGYICTTYLGLPHYFYNILAMVAAISIFKLTINMLKGAINTLLDEKVVTN